MTEESNVLALPGRVVAAAYRGLTRDGTIGASLNQARDELKEALRPLPDSIHVQPVSIAGDMGAEQPVATVHGPTKNDEKIPATGKEATVHGAAKESVANDAATPPRAADDRSQATEQASQSPSDANHENTPDAPDHGQELSHKRGRSR